ncbi:MAG: hypothetical protein MJZ64_04975 [Paludibacteraceae bacterium]|nr:hypothetical protein [Paludibacteraceae bacterium]
MKKLFPIIIAVAFGMTACDSKPSQYTPYISLSYFYLNPIFDNGKIISAEDTLNVHTVDGLLVLDTITMQDTVVFAAGYGSIGNDLVSARVMFDTTQVNMRASLSEDITKILLPISDIRNLQLFINPGYLYVSIPLGYRPLQQGTHRMQFVVESDSQFSPRSVTYFQPVKE